MECNVLLDKESNSPGSDAIPAEIYKAGGQPMAEKLTELFHCMWRKEARPQEFKDASIIHIYKRKETAQVYHNHRDNSVMACLHRSRPIESTLNGYSMAENTMLNSVGTCTVQHDVLRHAYRCFSGLWWWFSNQIPLWWQAVQSKTVASQIEGADRRARWASLLSELLKPL